VASNEIELDGATYVRSRDAARVVQLAPDYVSRLARERVISAVRVEGLWFVNLKSLQDFCADQERQREIWRAEQAQRRREEQLAAGHPSALRAVPA
jgi:hypothetical protein